MICFGFAKVPSQFKNLIMIDFFNLLSYDGYLRGDLSTEPQAKLMGNKTIFRLEMNPSLYYRHKKTTARVVFSSLTY